MPRNILAMEIIQMYNKLKNIYYCPQETIWVENLK